MMMIEIEDSKVERMSGYAEKMLKYGGKLMQCIEELSEGGAAWDSATTATMTMTSMTTWDNVAVMETVADTAEDTGTVMAAARWASAAECPEQDAIQDTVSLTRRDGGFPRPG